MFNILKNENMEVMDIENNRNSELMGEEVPDPIINITGVFHKPANFDEFLVLSNHYQDMEEIIESLKNMSR